MANVRLSCPTCSFSRDLPEEKVPDRTVRVTCPKCNSSFDFQKPAPRQQTKTPQTPPLSPPAPPDKNNLTKPVPAKLPQPRPQPAPPDVSKGTRVMKSRRFLLLTIGILLTGAAAGIYFYGSPLSLLSRGGTERQVITIPPPAGGIPASLPQGVVTGAGSAIPTGAGFVPTITPTIEIGSGTDSTGSAGSLNANDLSVFIYAVNSPGIIRVNGQEFKTIKSEPDMQYNINTFGKHFRSGENSIEFDVTPKPGGGLPPSIHMKVSHKGQVVGEWRLSDKDGWPRSVKITIPEEK